MKILEKLDADHRAIRQINFGTDLDRAGNTAMFFIIEEANKLSQAFHKEM